MKSIEITLKSTLVAQFSPGKVNAVVDSEGTVYLPAMNIPAGDCAGSCGKCYVEDNEEDEKEEAPVVKETKKEAPKAEKMDVETYTEEDLSEMPSKELENILRKTYKIEPNDFDGKNTNKKLRELILKAQCGMETTKSEESEENEKDESSSETLESKVESAIKDFEDGVSKKKTFKIIAELVDKDEDDINEVLEDFEEEKITVAEAVGSLLGKNKSAGKTKKSEEALVDLSELKKGDKVSVWWDDENKDWFNGVVSGITRKGKVMVDYEDESSEEIDPEIHTKIKLIK